MAKARFAKGLRTGSTISETYSTLATQKEGRVQIIKDRVFKIGNPQSDAQMKTRVAFATVGQAAAAMKDIVEISREGLTKRDYARQDFISENTKLLKVLGDKRGRYAAFSPKGNKVIIPNSYIVSKGTLELPEWAVPKVLSDNSEVVGSFEGAYYKDNFKIGSLPYGDYTVEELWRTGFGLRPGDQLTFPQILTTQKIVMSKYTEDEQGNIEYDDVVKACQFVAPRLVLLETMPSTTITINASTTASEFHNALQSGINAAKSDAALVSNFIEVCSLVAGSQADTKNVNCSDSFDAMCSVSDLTTLAVGCILSRKTSSGWQYSTTQLVCVFESMNTYEPAEDSPKYFGYSMWGAMQTYKKTTKTSDTTFLQRATQSNILPEDFQ